MYFGWGGSIFRLLDGGSTGTDSWSPAEFNTTIGVPQDATVFNNILFVALGTGWATKTAGVWAQFPGGAGTGASHNVTDMCIWDSKIWHIGQDTTGIWQTYFSLDGTTFTKENPGVIAGNLQVLQLVTFRDVSGNSVLAAVTDQGLWLYDATNHRWLPSEARWPAPPIPVNPGHKTVWFRDGSLYTAPGGLTMLQLTPGTTLAVASVGLDNGDGVPSEDDGSITAMDADFNWVIALLDGSIPVSTTNDPYQGALGQPFDSSQFPPLSGTVSLRYYNQGWHCLWEQAGVAGGQGVVCVSSAYHKRRVYWAVGGTMYRQDLPTQNYNPRQNLTLQFAPGPVTHITPWWDFSNETQLKIHGHLFVWVDDASATETVHLYYQVDWDESKWYDLGAITASGQTEIHLGGKPGRTGHFFRFRIDLARGSTVTSRPIVAFYTSEVMRILPPTFSFAADIDISRPVKGITPAGQIRALKALADPAATPDFYTIAFQDETESGQLTTYLGRISRLSGQEEAGESRRGRGQYTVSLMCPYRLDLV
jgi:hypothetical protein